jgi:hypothetical protein
MDNHTNAKTSSDNKHPNQYTSSTESQHPADAENQHPNQYTNGRGTKDSGAKNSR